jgi:hypothetical protein
MGTEPNRLSSSDRFSVLIAILIAISAIVGAVVAWRAAVSDDRAGDGDFAGVAATLNKARTNATSAVNAFQAHAQYLQYREAFLLRTALERDLLALPAESNQRPILEAELRRMRDVQSAYEQNLDYRFIRRDGTFDVARYMAEKRADAARAQDLNPAPAFAEADAFRHKTAMLLATGIPLALSLVFLTFAEIFAHRWRQVMFVLGTCALLGGIVMLIAIELTVR